MTIASQVKTNNHSPLSQLREEMTNKKIEAFLVPLTDRFKSEYVPDCDKRLAFLTGFTGSTGFAIAGLKQAVLFVDGRYTIEAKNSVDPTLFEISDYTQEQIAQWLRNNITIGGAIGFDPWLHSKNETDWLTKICTDLGAKLQPTHNLIDIVWTEQPKEPTAPMRLHPIEYAGVSSREKCVSLSHKLREKKIDRSALIATDSVAWLLNTRGGDVAFNPVTLAYAFLNSDSTVDLFVDVTKVSPECHAEFKNHIRIHPMDSLESCLSDWAKAGQKIQIDPSQIPFKIYEILTSQGAKVVFDNDPCALPKACKNPVELAGTKAAHIRDGVAVTKFLHWLAQEVPTRKVTEIEAADYLEKIRRTDPLFQGNSFDTISGSGPHGAIIHYRVSEKTNRQIQMNEIYLVDSGGQYLDGTTDITRTLIFGEAAPEQKDRFTRVLKGHIAIAKCRFPAGTTGSQIDVLARQSLWQAGLDYAHGTGHGVGSYLNVHEGPQRIAKIPNSIPLVPGMIVSNEPGYYKEGAYGIRIENLVEVVHCDPIPGAEHEMYCFQNLTFVPLERNLIDINLLTEEEIAWVNSYHAHVRTVLKSYLEGADLAWLEKSTRGL